MSKNFNIEELKKTNPFKVPEGYFDTLASRVMAQIPEESSAYESKKKAKVVGMIPRKKNNGWVKWAVGIAACVCGLALFLTNNPEDQTSKKLAMTTIPITSANDEVDGDATVQENIQTTKTKHYSNDAFALSSRHKRSTYAEEPHKKFTAYVPTERKYVATTATSDLKKNDVTSKTVTKRSTDVSSVNIASNTITISASDLDQVNNEYDLLDYTQMGGSDIYDYLAGNEYY